jgi:hypothetical protein
MGAPVRPASNSTTQKTLLQYLFCRNIRETLASKGLMLLEWLKKPRFYTKKLYWY